LVGEKELFFLDIPKKVIDFSPTLFWNQVHLVKEAIKSMLGKKPKKTMARIINKRHFKRMTDLLDEPGVKDSIVHGGSTDEDTL